VRFAKWQGLGNDYLVIDAGDLPAPLTASAVSRLCDRHLGVGGDGILVLEEPTGAVFDAVARMRVFNPDGGEPEMCGNGIRLFARYMAQRGVVTRDEFVIETLAGPIRPRLLPDGLVRVDMGKARVDPGRTVDVEGRSLDCTVVDVGNPHCIITVDDPFSFPVTGIGPLVEHHPMFPNRTNVEFIRMEPDGSVTMRVWERGVGETQACGTGATAVGAAAVRVAGARSPVTVHLLGGDLIIEVAEDDRAFMTGPAVEVFTGSLSQEMMKALGW
jgi:diaminopimelate epimerase